MKNDKLTSWGGKRSGAGRPSTGRSKKIIYVTDEEYTEVKKLIDKLRVNIPLFYPKNKYK